MRAADTYTESLFTVKKLEDFIPQNHPLRPIRKMVNEILGQDHRQHALGNGTGTAKSRSDVYAQDGSLQPHPYAIPSPTPS